MAPAAPAVPKVAFDNKPAGGKSAAANPAGGTAKPTGGAISTRALKGGFRDPETSVNIDAQREANRLLEEEAAQAALVVTTVLDTFWFNMWVTLTAVAYTLVLGFELQMVPDDAETADRLMWWLIQCALSVCFMCDVLLRAFIMQWGFLTSFWHLCDAVLVLAVAFDLFALSPGGIIRFFGALRMLHATILVKLLRNYTVMREAWLLVGGLVNSIKSLTWVGILVFLMNYVCGIMVTVAIGQNDSVYGDGVGPSYDGELWPHKEYFGTVWKSMFTLFQVMTLDAWSDEIVRHVVYRQPGMVAFFLLYVVVSAFGMMNVVVGIIVENTLAAAAVAEKRSQEKMQKARRDAVDKLADILVTSAANRSGTMTQDELQLACTNDYVKEQFNKCGLSYHETLEIFRIMDYDKKGVVDLHRFANTCRDLVGGGSRRDIVQVEVTVGQLHNRLDHMDEKFSIMERQVQALDESTMDFVTNTVRVLTGFDCTLNPDIPGVDPVETDFRG